MKIEVNEITVSYKGNFKKDELPEITCSHDAGKLLYQQWNKKTIGLHESLKVILLNNSNKVKGIYEISSGGTTEVSIGIRMLFAVLLKTVSSPVILAHNHPSGASSPVNRTNVSQEK